MPGTHSTGYGCRGSGFPHSRGHFVHMLSVFTCQVTHPPSHQLLTKYLLHDTCDAGAEIGVSWCLKHRLPPESLHPGGRCSHHAASSTVGWYHVFISDRGRKQCMTEQGWCVQALHGTLLATSLKWGCYNLLRVTAVKMQWAHEQGKC